MATSSVPNEARVEAVHRRTESLVPAGTPANLGTANSLQKKLFSKELPTTPCPGFTLDVVETLCFSQAEAAKVTAG